METKNNELSDLSQTSVGLMDGEEGRQNSSSEASRAPRSGLKRSIAFWQTSRHRSRLFGR